MSPQGTKGGVWICEAKTERAYAVALSAKVLGAIRSFPATTEAVPLGKVASPQAMTEGVISPLRKEIGKKMSKSVDNRPGVWYYT